MEISKLTQAQQERFISWCQSHDWGQLAVIRGDRVYGLYDSCSDKLVSFDNKKSVYEWAGY